MPDFLLPDLGEGLDDAEVIAWRIAVGDHVSVDQVIAEVETAKAVVEVPVPYPGIVTKLHARPGETLSVGQPLVTVTTVADEPAGSREPGAESGGEEASGSVLIGYGTTAAPPRRRRGTRRAASTAPRVAVISPLARKIARDAGLDLASIRPTGPDGVVSRRDVRQAIAERSAPSPQTRQPETVSGSQAQRVGQAAVHAVPGERRIPLRGARRTAADKLARSRREIPEATVWVDVDATELLETRRMLNARDPQRPVGLLALLARFSIAGLRKYPELNARVEPEEIVMSDRVNLGFAAQTEHGLVVPVVPDAHLLSTRDLAARLAERTAAARQRRLAPADMAGGTFTVNNYGVFGVDGSAAIINHPEVAILGMGRVIDRPWVIDGKLTVRKITELTLSFDHRACDGGTAGGFLRYVADCIESPAAAIGDM